MTEIAIVILNWNKCELTLQCIDSIVCPDKVNVKIVVVDNGSTDGSKEVLGRRKDILLVSMTENTGFAKGTNIGIRIALVDNPQYILLLNNDAVLTPDTIEVFLSHAMSADIITPKIYYHNSDVIWACGGYVKNKQAMAMNIGQGERDKNQYCMIKEVDFASGCAMWLNVKVIHKIGCFAEKYISYYEDVDYCLRARSAGTSIKYIPEIIVYHHAGATSGGEYNSYQSYFRWRNRLLLNQSNGTLIHKIIFMTILPIIIIRDSFKYVSRGKHRELIEAYKGLLSVIPFGK